MFSTQISSQICFAQGRLDLSTGVINSVITPDMKRTRTCFRCRCSYVEWKNIGAWRCQRHVYPFDNTRRLYPCCNAVSARGCQVLDHAESMEVPYPGCDSINGVPALQLCEGNLEELQDVRKEAIQHPQNYDQLVREGGDKNKIKLRVYRVCLFGVPLQPTNA